MKKRIAIVPGSFDPPTNGHLDLFKRTANLFDEVIVTISRNTTKKGLFTEIERKKLIENDVKYIANISVVVQVGLTIQFAEEVGATAIVRGLRGVKDYEYEAQIALMNQYQNNQIETLFLVTDKNYQFVSSSMVKEVMMFQGDVTGLVSDEVVKALREKMADEI